MRTFFVLTGIIAVVVPSGEAMSAMIAAIAVMIVPLVPVRVIALLMTLLMMPFAISKKAT